MLDKGWTKPAILEKWENYNIDIPLGRKMFRKHFEEIIRDSGKGIGERMKDHEDF